MGGEKMVRRTGTVVSYCKMLAKPCFPTVYVATLTKFTSLYKLAHLSYLRKRASTDRTRTCIEEGRAAEEKSFILTA